MRDKKLVDHYAVLAIARGATPDQIKKAWSKLQTLYHPDKNHGLPEHLVKLAEEKLKEINAAKAVLLDPEKRAELDQLLNESEKGSAPATPAFVPEAIDLGLIKAGETRRAHLDIQNLGGPPTNPPDLDMSPDADWFEVVQAAPSDHRFWFGLDLTATNASDGVKATGPRDAWISITVDGATARAKVSGFFEPSLNSREFSVDALACELVDSDIFLSETPTGGVHLCGDWLSPLIRRLAEYSDVDLYPEDWLREKFGEEKEEFQEMLRVMGASGKSGYRSNDRPMRNGWNRFLKTGDLPKALGIDSDFSEYTADVTIAARSTEFAKILSVESKQVLATILYLRATARLGYAGANAAGNNCGNRQVLNDLLGVIRDACVKYRAANELALSDKIREAIELTERLEKEALKALSQVEEKRSKWLRSKHLCVECEKALGWGERLAGSDRHSDCAAKSGGAAESSRPRWGMIGAALGVVVLVAMFGGFDTKPEQVNLPIAHDETVSPQQPEQSVCSAENKLVPQDASSMPPQSYYDWHTCPGEGCSYPQGLVSTADMAIRTKPDIASDVAFTVKRGTRLVADDGVNVTTAPGRLVLLAPVPIGAEWARVGETIYEYTNYGEGFALTWFRGRFFSCQTAIWLSDRTAEQQQEAVYLQWHKVRDVKGRTGWISGDTERLAGGGEPGGCGQVPKDFFAGGLTACQDTTRDLTNSKPAPEDTASEKIRPGESRENWSLDKIGIVRFQHQIVSREGAYDPTTAELRLSKGSQNETFRYAILVDTDKGPVEGYIWRQNEKQIVARIPVRGISDTVFWSDDSAHAVITDSGEVQQRVYVINLQTGQVVAHQIDCRQASRCSSLELSSPQTVVADQSKCEIQGLYGQPASWVGNQLFQLRVKVEANFYEGEKCAHVKTRSMFVDIPMLEFGHVPTKTTPEDKASEAIRPDDTEARENAVERELAHYTALIQQKVTRSWLRPPSARPGMSCVVRVSLEPSGGVLDARVIVSSGDRVFDRSVERGVRCFALAIAARSGAISIS